MARGLQSHQPSYQQSSAAFRDVFRVLDEVDVIVNEGSILFSVTQDSGPASSCSRRKFESTSSLRPPALWMMHSA